MGSAPWLVTWPHTPLSTTSLPCPSTPPPHMALPAFTAPLGWHWEAPRARQVATHLSGSQPECPPPQHLPFQHESYSVLWGLAPHQVICWGHGSPHSVVHSWILPQARATERCQGWEELSQVRAMSQMTHASKRVGITIITPWPAAGTGRKTLELGQPNLHCKCVVTPAR